MELTYLLVGINEITKLVISADNELQILFESTDHIQSSTFRPLLLCIHA